MPAGYHALTEKEKQTLRLIVRGHDAKSTARHLGLSVHTINERLRDARRKLEVSSSREAARLVLENEAPAPENLADRFLGEADAPADMAATPAPATNRDGSRRLRRPIAGAFIMSLLLATLALTALPSAEAPSADAGGQATTTSAARSEVASMARAWLELGDEARWADGWRATSEQFRKLNTVQRWTDASEKARVPLGAVVSRTFVSQQSVPTPPAGAEMIKFRTDFANRQGVTETVTLAREDGGWKVVGVYLDW